MVSEKDICRAILALGKAADSIDDGYHNALIFNIVKLRNQLDGELSEETRNKFHAWYDGRTMGGRLIEEG
ncbi:MAG: hypothetical protein J6Y02_01365 [Pseudobutyrivibrio sp.]|nr:hypothetical protein [Pseudobutyrivibrio sp.]